jgi:hypothetical protein
VTTDLLKARDVADMLGLEVGTVLDHFEAGDIPGFRLWGKKGGPVRFRLGEVLEVLETWRTGSSCTVGANGAATADRPAPGTGGASSDAIRILRPVDDE